MKQILSVRRTKQPPVSVHLPVRPRVCPTFLTDGEQVDLQPCDGVDQRRPPVAADDVDR